MQILRNLRFQCDLNALNFTYCNDIKNIMRLLYYLSFWTTQVGSRLYIAQCITNLIRAICHIKITIINILCNFWLQCTHNNQQRWFSTVKKISYIQCIYSQISTVTTCIYVCGSNSYFHYLYTSIRAWGRSCNIKHWCTCQTVGTMQIMI